MKKRAPFRIKVKSRSPGREYDVVIGLEVHTHLKTESKLFCACSTDFGAPPNANVCPVCAGMPGALPVLNGAAIEAGIKAALALNLRVNRTSTFARKNYFYPDLPKGYQISQYDQPLSSDGHLEIEIDGASVRIGIERAHLEEDAGKLVHTGADGIAGATGALVDLNRSSTPLLEIVSAPDISSPEQAVKYLKKLRERLIFAGAIDGHMEEGGLRCDANISLKPKSSPTLGVKVEIKNLNSFKFLLKALQHEIKRQRGMLDKGETVIQETRGFDPVAETTFSMRRKEEAHDYRYFPDPDLLPVELTRELIDAVARGMPELPDRKRAKYDEWGLNPDQSALLLGDVRTAALFESCVAATEGRRADFAKWFLNVFIGELKLAGLTPDGMKAEPADIARIYDMKRNGDVSEKSIAHVLSRCLKEGLAPDALVEREGLAVIRDDGVIESAVDSVLDRNRSQVAEYRAGSEKIFNFLVGQVMREMRGRVDFTTAGEILRRRLEQHED